MRNKFDLNYKPMRHIFCDQREIRSRDVVLKLERSSEREAKIFRINAHQGLGNNIFKLDLQCGVRIPKLIKIGLVTISDKYRAHARPQLTLATPSSSFSSSRSRFISGSVATTL